LSSIHTPTQPFSEETAQFNIVTYNMYAEDENAVRQA
jgi:hypothetical protein